MCAFPGGSAWAMARDIAEGFFLPTDRSLARLTGAELDRLGFEVEKKVRELRGEAIDLEDHQALTARNRRLGRLVKAAAMLRSPTLRKHIR